MKKVKEYVYSKILKLDQINTPTQLSESTNTVGNTNNNYNNSGGGSSAHLHNNNNDANNNNNYKSTDINNYMNNTNHHDKNNSIGDSSGGGVGGQVASKDTMANAQRMIELICSDQVFLDKKLLKKNNVRFFKNI